jgi:hypothetical protein
MSEEQLLKRLGEFLYGEQWQAPLARDLGVGERSMRRWAAGTDPIPNGVWRDLGFRLDSVDGDLQHLIGEVKGRSGLVEVHSFKVYDSRSGEMVQPRVKSTAGRISRIGGTIIAGSAEWLPPWSIDSEGRVRTDLPAAPLPTEKVEAIARALWVSDYRVNHVAWRDGDPQTKSFYRILAAAAVHVRQPVHANPGFQTQVGEPRPY